MTLSPRNENNCCFQRYVKISSNFDNRLNTVKLHILWLMKRLSDLIRWVISMARYSRESCACLGPGIFLKVMWKSHVPRKTSCYLWLICETVCFYVFLIFFSWFDLISEILHLKMKIIGLSNRLMSDTTVPINPSLRFTVSKKLNWGPEKVVKPETTYIKLNNYFNQVRPLVKSSYEFDLNQVVNTNSVAKW